VEAAPGRELVTDDDVEAFWRDGVVCLRGVVPQGWLDRMADAVERVLSGGGAVDLSAMGDDVAAATGAPRTIDESVRRSVGARGRFRAGTDHWRDDPEFLAFATTSPLGAIVARLLRSDEVRLYEDSVLVKEPGTEERTAFHQDMAYFHLDGDRVCTTWVPLDRVDETTGAVRYVVGSHRDRTRYRPNLFVTTMALPGTEGAEVPDFDERPAPAEQHGAARIVSFDTEPGDVVVHHARTIHGAHANASATRRRRAVSVRYAGDGTTFRPVPGAPEKPHHAGATPGRPLDDDRFPRAWPPPPRG
jgi:ectoine hydroxylase-related dioxygenase (phytanoyl-CoA dioxygenase family)